MMTQPALQFETRNLTERETPASAPSPGFDGSEKREFRRDPAHDLSEIILDGRRFGVACLIHDISEGGARLEVSCGELPKRFVLANYTRRTKTLCRMVWRKNQIIGVNFLTKPRPFSIDERL